MDFRRNVRAHLLAGEFKQAELICPALRIDIGERLEGILADGGVTARQFPSPNRNDRQVVREIRSEKLHAMMNAEGRLETLLAEQNVQGEQTVPGTGKAKPTITKFVADRLTAKFAAATNQVQTMVAERNVTIEQDGRTAHGSHAHYDGASQVLELTGQPTAVAPEGRITEAEVLVWDAAKEQLRVKGKFKSEWQRLRTARMDEALKR